MFNIFNTLDDGDIKEIAQEEYKNIKASDELKNKIMKQVNSEEMNMYKHKHRVKRRLTVILAAAISLMLIVGAGAAIYTGRVFVPHYGFIDTDGIEIYTLPEIQEFGDMIIETAMRIKEDGKNKILIVLTQTASRNSLLGKGIFDKELTLTTAKGETISMTRTVGAGFGGSNSNDFMYSQFEAEGTADINEFILNYGGISAEVRLAAYDPSVNKVFECETQSGVSIKIHFFTKRSVFLAVEYGNENTPEFSAYVNELLANEDYSDDAYATMQRAEEEGWSYTVSGVPEFIRFSGFSFTDINGKVYEKVNCSASINSFGDKRYNCLISDIRPEAEIVSMGLKSLEIELSLYDLNFYAGLGELPNLEVGESYEFETPIRILDFDGFNLLINSVNCLKADDGAILYNINMEINNSNPNITLERIHFGIFTPETQKYSVSTGSSSTQRTYSLIISRYKGNIDFSKMRLLNFSYKIYGNWTFK